MQARDIIKIDEELCNGCGQCLVNCAEGALALVDGKARLVGEVYCDGLGACLGHCPTGALTITRREAPAFDEAAVKARQAAGGGCPGSQAQAVRPAGLALRSWPIQLKLVPAAAAFLDAPALTLASDCSAFAAPLFHQTFLQEGYPLAMACPKLDEREPYVEKLAAILAGHPAIREIRLVLMAVPCCGGLGYIAGTAIKKAGRQGQVAVRTWVVELSGEIAEEHIR